MKHLNTNQTWSKKRHQNNIEQPQVRQDQHNPHGILSPTSPHGFPWGFPSVPSGRVPARRWVSWSPRIAGCGPAPPVEFGPWSWRPHESWPSRSMMRSWGFVQWIGTPSSWILRKTPIFSWSWFSRKVGQPPTRYHRIGLRENLQENPILNEKIDGFL